METSPFHVVLTGFMGTGKSTVGRMVAKDLGRPFVDTDAMIAGRHGSILEIFETHGEDGFRSFERDVVAELARASTPMVIATGGGTLLNPESACLLGARSRIFCLAASLATVQERLLRGKVSRRPLLAGPDPEAQIAVIFSERAPQYAAFEQVPTDRQSHRNVADEIISRVKSGKDQP